MKQHTLYNIDDSVNKTSIVKFMKRCGGLSAYLLVIVMTSFMLASCDEFLDTMPDNRSELDEPEKIFEMLTSAYPVHDYVYFNELMSDNWDEYPRYKNHTTLSDSCWTWSEVSETGTYSPSNVWSDAFSGITTANMALEAIDKLNPDEYGDNMPLKLREARAEAIILRAYHHFILANVFCAPYNKEKNASQLGLPYQYKVERELSPHYERGTLDKFYEAIQKDLEEALPNIGESNFDEVPKYHFNINAAYAFATRFYLFTEQWQKAVDCANRVLGSDPAGMLRDWAAQAAVGSDRDQQGQKWIDAECNANLLLCTTYGNYRNVFGNVSTLNHYSHGNYVATSETMRANNPWGNSSSAYIKTTSRYSSNTLDRVLWWKMPYFFQYTNIIKGNGYTRSVYTPLTADEVLLARAEANIMLGNYEQAVSDMNIWARSIYNGATKLTVQYITDFYNKIKYYSPTEPTIKKHLNPAFDIGEEGGVKESLLQCVLQMRRVQGFYEGLRWWDIRRYGIVIYRRAITFDGSSVEQVLDELPVDDLRRTLQIPKRSIDAGFQPNPR